MKLFVWLSAAFAAVIAIAYFVLPGALAQIGDLPAHPLVVHSAVVLVPLLTLFIIIGVFSRKFLEATHLWLIGGLGVTAIAVIASKSSGQSLRAIVSVPDQHVTWGDILVPVTIGLFVGYVVFVLVTVYRPIRVLSIVLAVAVSVTAVSATGLAVLAGHSGAESVWKSIVAPTPSSSPSSPSTKPTKTQKPKPTETAVPNAAGITRAEVSAHATPEDCWAIIGDGVYDLTSFVSRHPGGSTRIERICGKDATDKFLGQHGGQAQPEQELAALRFGDYAG